MSLPKRKNISPVGVDKGHSYPAGTTTYEARKAFRTEVAEAQYSTHGYKHLKASTAAEAKAFSSNGGAAQYLPEVSNAGLEKIALQKGFTVDHGGGYHTYIKFDQNVGYSNGHATAWIRAEMSGGAYHGHPVLDSQVPQAALTTSATNKAPAMELLKIETPGLEKASIRTSDAWTITYHRLFQISPDEVDKVPIVEGKVPIWHLCFHEDLLQIENRSEGLLVDVGWYPDSDPTGTFRLKVVSHFPKERRNGRSPYDWDHPKLDFRTRSIDELLARIRDVVS